MTFTREMLREQAAVKWLLDMQYLERYPEIIHCTISIYDDGKRSAKGVVEIVNEDDSKSTHKFLITHVGLTEALGTPIEPTFSLDTT